jgi:hypothetical protein
MKFSSSLREASMLGSSGLFQAVLGVLGVVLTPGLMYTTALDQEGDDA